MYVLAVELLEDGCLASVVEAPESDAGKGMYVLLGCQGEEVCPCVWCRGSHLGQRS